MLVNSIFFQIERGEQNGSQLSFLDKREAISEKNRGAKFGWPCASCWPCAAVTVIIRDLEQEHLNLRFEPLFHRRRRYGSGRSDQTRGRASLFCRPCPRRLVVHSCISRSPPSLLPSLFLLSGDCDAVRPCVPPTTLLLDLLHPSPGSPAPLPSSEPRALVHTFSPPSRLRALALLHPPSPPLRRSLMPS